MRRYLLVAGRGLTHLCATTMVVLPLQTLASEAWMFLSVWVSREDVACMEEPNKGHEGPEEPCPSSPQVHDKSCVGPAAVCIQRQQIHRGFCEHASALSLSIRTLRATIPGPCLWTSVVASISSCTYPGAPAFPAAGARAHREVDYRLFNQEKRRACSSPSS